MFSIARSMNSRTSSIRMSPSSFRLAVATLSRSGGNCSSICSTAMADLPPKSHCPLWPVGISRHFPQLSRIDVVNETSDTLAKRQIGATANRLHGFNHRRVDVGKSAKRMRRPMAARLLNRGVQLLLGVIEKGAMGVMNDHHFARPHQCL